jgi:hypothetical protein
MVTHQLVATTFVNQSVIFSPVVMRVTRPSELPGALAQRASPVVIEDEGLERSFARFERWQAQQNTYRYIATLIALMVALAIAYGYGIEASWSWKWNVQRLDGKITLTPKQ